MFITKIKFGGTQLSNVVFDMKINYFQLRTVTNPLVPVVLPQQIWMWKDLGGMYMFKIYTPSMVTEGVKVIPAMHLKKVDIYIEQQLEASLVTY